jgi:hypothetical protein
MTKDQEIKRLKEIAFEFGKDSYCGPWLDSVIEEVESDIKNDFPPSPSFSESRRQVAIMLHEAIEEAKKIIEEATKKKMKIADEIDEIMNHAAAALMNAQHKLNNY